MSEDYIIKYNILRDAGWKRGKKGLWKHATHARGHPVSLDRAYTLQMAKLAKLEATARLLNDVT